MPSPWTHEAVLWVPRALAQSDMAPVSDLTEPRRGGFGPHALDVIRQEAIWVHAPELMLLGCDACPGLRFDLAGGGRRPVPQ